MRPILRVIVGRVRTARAATALALAMLAGCSGGGTKAGTFNVPTSKSSTQASPGADQTPLGKLKPPAAARLFAGTNSVVGELTHYCKASSCEDASPRTPAFVKAKDRTFVVFTVGSEPLAATAEVRVRPSEKPSTVTLEPGSLMVFNHGLGPGRYLIDLFVRWRSSEARWRFGMTISE
jgi:hypothetical protein